VCCSIGLEQDLTTEGGCGRGEGGRGERGERGSRIEEKGREEKGEGEGGEGRSWRGDREVITDF